MKTMESRTLAELNAAVWSLAALRVAVESDLFEALATGENDIARLAKTAQLAPEITRDILGVLEASGFVALTGDTVKLTEEGGSIAGQLDWTRADLAATFGQAEAFTVDARRSDLASGFHHADPEIIRAYGRLSEMMTTRMVPPLLAAHPDLARLERGGTTLDVGAGAGGGLIGLCKRFAALRGVGLEPLKAARIEARAAIRAAGLSERIEVRPTRIQELDDRAVYDLAFVATAHMTDEALRHGLERVRRALVPGGYVLLAGFRPSSEARITATARLRWRCWGGGPRSAADVARMATEAGFVDIREAPVRGNLSPFSARAPQ